MCRQFDSSQHHFIIYFYVLFAKYLWIEHIFLSIPFQSVAHKNKFVAKVTH